MRRIGIMWVPLLLALAGTASAQELGDLFAQGNQAHFEGDYDTAVARYERLLEAGVRDADVSFNLATAHARRGELGRAVLHFERSLAQDPGDGSAELGLRLARDALGRRRAESEGEATVRTRPPLRHAIVRPFSENQLAWSSLLCCLALFLSLGIRMLVRTEGLRVALGVAAPLWALLLLASATGLTVKAGLLQTGQDAVVLADAELLEGPDPRAELRATALEGSAALMLAQEGGFVQVKLTGGQAGWLRASDVAPVRN